MATYPVVNTKTGEQKEVVMSVTQWDQWCSDNPDWSRTILIPLQCQVLVKLENGKIS